MVAKYVALGPSLPKWPPAKYFSPLGRATPDVSALGEGYQVYVDGEASGLGEGSLSLTSVVLDKQRPHPSASPPRHDHFELFPR